MKHIFTHVKKEYVKLKILRNELLKKGRGVVRFEMSFL